MAFKKIKKGKDKGKYETPAGKTMTERQVRSHRATDGFQRTLKHRPRKK